MPCLTGAVCRNKFCHWQCHYPTGSCDDARTSPYNGNNPTYNRTRPNTHLRGVESRMGSGVGEREREGR